MAKVYGNHKGSGEGPTAMKPLVCCVCLPDMTACAIDNVHP